MINFLDAAITLREALWRACWQGGLALAIVFIFCRFAAGLSPSARCWLWRIAYFKLLVALIWATPVDLPILPAERPSSPITAPVNVVTESYTPTAFKPPASQDQPRFPWFLILWSVGMAWCISRVVRDVRSGRRLLIGCRPFRDARLCEQLSEWSADLRISTSPRLLLSDQISGPLLIGVRDPSIILPERNLSSVSPEPLRSVLAHELAHVKRADLKWNRLPSLSHVLFYFHPMVLLANREWRLAQEMACDELAMGICGHDPAQYGAALMQFASAGPGTIHGFAAAGFDESPHDLKRRLKAMQRYPRMSARRTSFGLAAVAIIGAALLVPWRVVAQTSKSEPAPAASSSANSQNNASEQRAMMERLRALEAQVKALTSKLAQERSRASADRKRELELLKKARAAEMNASQADRAKQEIQMREERARLEQLMQHERALKEDEAARARAKNDAQSRALREQLDADRNRSLADLKRAEELYKSGQISQADRDKMAWQRELDMQRLRAELDKVNAMRDRDQRRYQEEQLNLLDMAKAKLNHRAAEQQYSQAEQARLKALMQSQTQQQTDELARMKDLIRRQEEQIRDLERKTRERQDKQKGKQDQALLQYRIAASDARLARLRSQYTELHPSLKEALYEREYLAQLERSSKDRQDRAAHAEAIREDLTRKLLDLDQEFAKLSAELSDQHPRVKGLRAQRETLSSQIEQLNKSKRQ